MGEIVAKLPDHLGELHQLRSWTPSFLTAGLASKIGEVGQLPNLDRALHEITTRAVDTTAIATSGKTPATVFGEFINTAQVGSNHLALAQNVTAEAESVQLSRLIPDQDQLQTGADTTTNLTDTDGITFGGTTVALTELYWYERVTLNYLEDNIAGGDIEASVGRAVLAGFAEQLSKLALEGDNSLSGFISRIDGWVQHATDGGSTSFAAAAAEFANATSIGLFLDKLWDNMGARYRNRGDIVHLVNADALKRFEIETRAAGGDKVVTTRSVGPNIVERGFQGERIVGEERRHSDADQKNRVMCTPAANLVVATGRDMRVDAKFLPRLRAIDYVVTTRIGFGVRDFAAVKMGIPPAAIYGTGVVADGP